MTYLNYTSFLFLLTLGTRLPERLRKKSTVFNTTLAGS